MGGVEDRIVSSEGPPIIRGRLTGLIDSFLEFERIKAVNEGGLDADPREKRIELLKSTAVELRGMGRISAVGAAQC